MSESNVRQLNTDEILEKLRALEGKECSKYTEDENFLMYSAINFHGEKVYKEAIRILCDGMHNTIASIAGELLVRRGNVGKIRFSIALDGGTYVADPDMLEDMIHEGYKAMLVKVKEYDPLLGANISTYTNYWIRARLMVYINKEATPLSIPNTADSQIYDIQLANQECIKDGIVSPTEKDIYNKLRQQGKDMTKYTITTITELLKLGQSMPLSLDDELSKVFQLNLKDESNKDIPSDMVNNMPILDIVTRHMESEAVHNIIHTMDPLSRMALIAYIQAEEKAGDKTEEEKKRKKRISKTATEKDILKEFRTMYKYEIKSEDFSRLLYYAKDELKKRFEKYKDVQPQKSAKTPTFNSMDSIYDDMYIDDIFEAEIYDEDEKNWQEELEKDTENFLKDVAPIRKEKKNGKKQ